MLKQEAVAKVTETFDHAKAAAEQTTDEYKTM